MDINLDECNYINEIDNFILEKLYKIDLDFDFNNLLCYGKFNNKDEYFVIMYDYDNNLYTKILIKENIKYSFETNIINPCQKNIDIFFKDKNKISKLLIYYGKFYFTLFYFYLISFSNVNYLLSFLSFLFYFIYLL